MNRVIKNNRCIYQHLNLGPRKDEAAVETSRSWRFVLLSTMALVFQVNYNVFFFLKITLLWFYCRSQRLKNGDVEKYLCGWRRTETSRTALREVIGILGPNRLLSLCVFVHSFLLSCVWLSETNDTICRQPSSRRLHDLYIETHVLEHTQGRWEFGCIFRFQLLW